MRFWLYPGNTTIFLLCNCSALLFKRALLWVKVYWMTEIHIRLLPTTNIFTCLSWKGCIHRTREWLSASSLSWSSRASESGPFHTTWSSHLAGQSPGAETFFIIIIIHLSFLLCDPYCIAIFNGHIHIEIPDFCWSRKPVRDGCGSVVYSLRWGLHLYGLLHLQRWPPVCLFGCSTDEGRGLKTKHKADEIFTQLILC